MTEQVPSEETRPDMVCECYADDPPLWGPVCTNFFGDDFDYCVNCGHIDECHEQP